MKDKRFSIARVEASFSRRRGFLPLSAGWRERRAEDERNREEPGAREVESERSDLPVERARDERADRAAERAERSKHALDLALLLRRRVERDETRERWCREGAAGREEREPDGEAGGAFDARARDRESSPEKHESDQREFFLSNAGRKTANEPSLHEDEDRADVEEDAAEPPRVVAEAI